MKKAIFIVLIALLTVSCEDNTQDVQWKIIDLEVRQSDWLVTLDDDGLNRYYSSYFTIPEITSKVYNSGTVTSYIIINNTQQVLPYVRHFENTDGFMWTRTVDYDYSVGGMNVYVTNSDFADDLPETMKFRLVLMW